MYTLSYEEKYKILCIHFIKNGGRCVENPFGQTICIDGRSAELLGIILRNRRCIGLVLCAECPIINICKEIADKQPRVFTLAGEFNDEVFNEIIKKLDEKKMLTKDQLFEFLL